MASSARTAKVTLSYPLYAVDFDPDDDRRLIVGGGGGEGRSGVGNKITVLGFDADNRLSPLGEIELSRDEDSVTSLAYLRRTDPSSGVVLAGINSSSAAQEAGQNEHLRAFMIEYGSEAGSPDEEPDSAPNGEREAATEAHIESYSRRSLFQPGKETYQRVLRLSPTTGNSAASRVAAVATGLAREGEIVVLLASSGTTVDPILGRIALGKDREAADVDITSSSSSSGEYEIAFCTDDEVLICRVHAEEVPEKPVLLETRAIYNAANLGDPSIKSRPKFRALRFLSPGLLLVLLNLPARSGAELLVVRYGDSGPGEIKLRRRLHRTMKAAVGFEVSSFAVHGGQNDCFAVAVAGQDTSIEVLTLDHAGKYYRSGFLHHVTFRDVHPFQMTKITLAKVPPPTQKGVPWVLRLASVSMGKTVVVHSLPLAAVTTPSGTRCYGLRRKGQRAGWIVPFLTVLLAVALGLALRSNLSSTMVGHPRPITNVQSSVPVSSAPQSRPQQSETPKGVRQMIQEARGAAGSAAKPLVIKEHLGQVEADFDDDVETAAQTGAGVGRTTPLG